jgi:hypothetical protein
VDHLLGPQDVIVEGPRLGAEWPAPPLEFASGRCRPSGLGM